MIQPEYALLTSVHCGRLCTGRPTYIAIRWQERDLTCKRYSPFIGFVWEVLLGFQDAKI